jgi:hypothetical protein
MSPCIDRIRTRLHLRAARNASLSTNTAPRRAKEFR